jgi:hypothetical protein
MKNLSKMPVDQRGNWYNMMNVRVEEIRSRSEQNGIRYNEINGSQRFWIYGCAEFYDDEEQVWDRLTALMESKSEDLAQSPVIIHGVGSETQCPANLVYEIEILREDPQAIELSVSSRSDGWLVVADTWYPGWEAKVNQQSVPLYRANYLFRAVKIESGENKVEFKYQPLLLRGGLIGTFASLILLFGIAYYRFMD